MVTVAEPSVFRGTLSFFDKLRMYDMALPIIFLSLLFYGIYNRLIMFNKLKKWQIGCISIITSLLFVVISKLVADVALICFIAFCIILYFLDKWSEFKKRNINEPINNYKVLISLAIVSFVLAIIGFLFQLIYYSSQSTLTPIWPLILAIILGIISFILAILFFIYTKGAKINPWWRLLVLLALLIMFSHMIGAVYEYMVFNANSVVVSSLILVVIIVIIIVLFTKPKKVEKV